MKIKLLRQVLLMTRNTFLGIFLQGLLCGLLVANDINGQKKESIEDIYISLDIHKSTLDKVFEKITDQTELNFVYEKTGPNFKKKYSTLLKNESVGNVLRYISRDANLKFKRINDNIYVSKLSEYSEAVSEVIELEEIKITGKVTSSEDSEGLPGVNVIVKGTSLGTVTDVEGNYSLQVPDQNSVLVFSSVGYVQEEVMAGNQTVINLSLVPDLTTLEEIVVVGYGSQKKKDLTGAVGIADVENMQKAPVASFEEALGGRIAGVNVTSNEGQPGDEVNIVIRGMGSITQNTSPLYVIDGIPIENPPSGLIDPADIEKISVLKDASAAAIYGARGANGVVLITTKSGKEGAARVTYDGYVGVSEVVNRMELLSPYEYVKLQYELSPNRTDTTYLKERTLESYKNEEPIDWQDQVFQQGMISSHKLTLGGGAKKGTLYNLSFSTFSQEGIIINSGFDRYNFRLNLDQQLNEKLRIGAQANYTRTKQYGTRTSVSGHAFSTYLLSSVLSYRPVSYDHNVDLLEEEIDPDINPLHNYQYNPILSAQNEHRESHNNYIRLNAYVEYKIMDDLTLKIVGGYNSHGAKNESFNNSLTRSGSPNSALGIGPNGSIRNREWISLNGNAFLTYNKKFGRDHKLNLMAGAEIGENKSESYQFSAFNVLVENNDVNGLDSGTPDNINTDASRSRLNSFLGRANYTFKDRYMLTATIRRDGSSKFLGDNQWSTFPSFALAWQLGDEEFMKKVSFIGDAKVRASWGQLGNNRVGDFASRAILVYRDYRYVWRPVYYAFNNELQLGVIPRSLENRNLKWETTEETNIGLDLGFLDNRLFLSTDVYRKTTRDLLLNAQLPTTTGYRQAFKNVGSIENSGMEITLGSVNIEKKNFRWTTDFNIAFNKNKVLSLNEGQTSRATTVRWSHKFNRISGYVTKVGEPIGQMYGYVWDGIYQLDEFDNFGDEEHPVYVLKPDVVDNGQARHVIQPGFIKYKDINGDGVVNDNDRTVIGDPTPKHIGGFTNDFTYKGITLHMFFQWSYGNDIYNLNRVYMEAAYRRESNLFASVADRWTPENPSTTMYSVRQGETGLQKYSSRIVEDGSFLRLKTVSLAYNFPQDLISKLRLQSAKIYVSGQNLYTWTDYSGYDPEVSVRNSALTRGVDFSAYPRARTLAAGINITF